MLVVEMTTKRGIDELAGWSSAAADDSASDERKSVEKLAVNLSPERNQGDTQFSNSNIELLQKTPFIFDDVAFQFNWNIFLLEVFVHLFPGGFLIVNYENHSFLNKFIMAWIFNLISILSVYILMLTYVMCGDEESNVIAQAYLVPLLLFVQHKVKK